MIASEHRVFRARLSALPETAAFVASFCKLHAIGRTHVLRLTLIVEELFTNTVEHGYGEECDAPIHIALSADRGAVGLLFEDAAPRYDPLSPLAGLAANLDAAVDSRPIGKLGIHLIRQLTDGARYAHEGGRNRLWLQLRCGSGADPAPNRAAGHAKELKR